MSNPRADLGQLYERDGLRWRVIGIGEGRTIHLTGPGGERANVLEHARLWDEYAYIGIAHDVEPAPDPLVTAIRAIGRPLPDRLDPDEIGLEREDGWRTFHPENYCHRCGGRNVSSWHVDSDRFNAAVAALGLTVAAILCPGCFVLGHELATGMQCSWALTPSTPFRHIEPVISDSTENSRNGAVIAPRLDSALP